MKFLSSLKFRWLLIIPTTILLLYVLLHLAFYSSTLSNYALNKAEDNILGLQIFNRKGSFAKGLHFDLRYTLDDIEVVLEKSELTISPICLLSFSVCVEAIEIATFRLDLAKNKNETNSSPLVLPEISLPIRLSIKKIAIGQVVIRQEGKDLYSAVELEAALDMQGNNAELSKFSSTDNFCRWNISANVALRRQYPLNANIACDAQVSFGAFSLVLSGDLSKLIGKAEASLSGGLVDDFVQNPAKLSMAFDLETLNPELLLNAELVLEEPTTFVNNDHEITLSKGVVKINGPIFNSVLNVVSNFETSLWPGSNDFNAQIDLSNETLELKGLQLLLPSGQLSAKGVLTISDLLHWRGEANWIDVDISQWQSEITGVISGRITKEIRYQNETLSADINLQNLSGDLEGEALSGSGQLNWRDDLLRIQHLVLQQNENKLTVDGSYSLSKEFGMSIALALPKINKLVPEAQGGLRGQIELSGRRDNIFIGGELAAKEMTYSDLKISSAHSHFSWYSDPKQDGNFVLSFDGVEKAKNMYGNVELRGLGNVNQHQLSLSLSGLKNFDHVAVLFSCAGSFSSGQLISFEQWSGKCEELNAGFLLAGESQDWALTSPIDVEVHLAPQLVEVSDFCFAQGKAKICNNEPFQFIEGDIKALSLSGSELSVPWLKFLIAPEAAPEAGREIELMGDWAFTFTGNNLLTTPNVLAKIKSDQIQAAWKREDQKPLSLDFTAIDADWSWQNSEHQINWMLESKNSGNSSGELSLSNKNISGHGTLKGLQLAQYSSFMFPNPQDRLAGLINADVSLSGDLDFPLINGSVSLQSGEFVSAALPIPLSEIEMNMVVENSQAKVIGSFQAAEGSGNIGGEFEWQKDTWFGELNLKAKDFVLKPNANSVVRISPNLIFKMSPQHLILSGEVLVPMARVLVKELPAQAISTSPDTVIVGRENVSNELTISTSLKVILGDDVRFTGFGLETGLRGNISIRQGNDAILKGDGVVQLRGGRYKAYGQNLKINNGDLIFVSDIENPQIRLEAIRDNISGDIEVGLRASGAASNPEIALFSRPEMPDQAKFSYLLTGNPPGYDDGSEFDPAQAAAEVALSYALESNAGLGITRRVAATFGVKDLKVATSSADGGTHVGLSGYLTPNLMVSYGVGVFDAVNTLTLDYRLRKNLSLEAISGESSALDLLWSFERD